MDHCSKGHTVMIYFGKERWVMSARPRARPVEKDLEGKRFRGPGETPVDAESTGFVHS